MLGCSRPAIHGVAGAAALAALLFASGSSCRWREGREVWIERYDAAPDAESEDADGDADGCASDEARPISAAALLDLIDAATPGLVIVDMRAESLCRALRIPRAQCVPFEDGAFTAPVDGLEEATHVVVYAQALDPSIEEAALTLDLACDQRLSVLEDGFQGWTEWDYETESDE